MKWTSGGGPSEGQVPFKESRVIGVWERQTATVTRVLALCACCRTLRPSKWIHSTHCSDLWLLTRPDLAASLVCPPHCCTFTWAARVALISVLNCQWKVHCFILEEGKKHRLAHYFTRSSSVCVCALPQQSGDSNCIKIAFGNERPARVKRYNKILPSWHDAWPASAVEWKILFNHSSIGNRKR